jgi:hypothetical protein
MPHSNDSILPAGNDLARGGRFDVLVVARFSLYSASEGRGRLQGCDFVDFPLRNGQELH